MNLHWRVIHFFATHGPQGLMPFPITFLIAFRVFKVDLKGSEYCFHRLLRVLHLLFLLRFLRLLVRVVDTYKR